MTETSPTSLPWAELREALALELLGDRPQAVSRLLSIGDRYPDFHDALSHLTWLRYLQGNTPEVLFLFAQIQEQAGPNTEAARRWFQAAVEAMEIDSAREAVPFLPEEERAIALQDVRDYEVAVGNSGPLARKQERWIANCLAPDYHFQPGDGPRLESLFKTCPSNPRVRLAWALYCLSHPDRNIHEWDRRAMVLLRPLWTHQQIRERGFEEIPWHIAYLADRLKDYETCLAAAEGGLRLFPDDLRMLRLMGVALEHLEQWDRATEINRRVLQRDPKSVGATANLLSLLERDKHIEEFASVLSAARKCLPAHPVLVIFEDRPRPPRPPVKAMEKTTLPVGLLKRIGSSLRPGTKEPMSPEEAATETAERLSGQRGFHRTPCNLCGSDSFAGVAVCSGNGWPVMRCERCGLVQINPQPTQETLCAKYQADYFSTELATAVHDSPPVGDTPMCQSQRVLAWLEDRGLASFEEQSGEPRRMLDVGCGPGVLLRDFRIRGWQVEGTEVGIPAVSFLRERRYCVHEGVLEDLELPQEVYDLATLNHVIEHLLDPLGELRRIFHLLRPGGWLFATTPGTDSLPEKIAGPGWYYDPDHTFFFSRLTLSETLAKAGFEILGEGSYVGAGHETCDAAWVGEGFGPTFTRRVAQANRGDVLLMLARKPTAGAR